MTAAGFDSARDAVALVRAWHERDYDALEVILDNADTREITRQLSLMLLETLAETQCGGCVSAQIAEWQEALRNVETAS